MTIAIPVPYVTIDEYYRILGKVMTTAREMIRQRCLPIRPKLCINGRPITRAKVEINMAALTIEPLNA